MTHASYDVTGRRALLLQVNHVALGEDAAPSCDPWRLLDLGTQLTELFYAEAQPRGLLVEKAPRTSGTERVHCEIRDLTLPVASGLLQEDELRVIATDLYDGVDVRVEMNRRRRLCNDLVDESDAQHLGDYASTGAGSGQPAQVLQSPLLDCLA